MLDQFSEDGRKTFVWAQEEARRLDHSRVGTEHLLLGLLRHDQDAVATVLAASGLALDGVRRKVEQAVGRGSGTPGGHLNFTVSALQAVEDAIAEAQQGNQKVGPRHLLLGILDRQQDTAVRVLTGLGTDVGRLRQGVVESLASSA